MTAATAPALDRGELRRWTICAALVLAAHALPAAVLLWWLEPPVAVTAPPPAAVMIDMAPMPAAPDIVPTEAPPGPEQTQAEAPPPEPPPAPIPLPETLPQVQPAAALPPAPKPHPPARPVPETPHRKAPPVDPRPAPATTAPPAAEVPPAAVPTAPAAGVSSATASNSAPTWQALLLGRLEQFKRYPPDAQVRRQQGVAYLRFSMDRAGNVLRSSVEKGSGVGALDREALALIQRAQPLPKPPADVPGDPIELVVPIEFFLNAKG
jgi:protein TonB